MENAEPVVVVSPEDSSSSLKNILIIVLLCIVIFSFLGINLLNKSGDILETLKNIFGPMITQILSVFGYSVGSFINVTADAVTDTAKTGLDISHDTVHDIGDLMINASQNNMNVPMPPNPLDARINQSPISSAMPVPDTTTNPIQNPISSNKIGWCLVGEYQDKRGCIEVSKEDKCISGQIFPDKKTCTNPVVNQPPFIGTVSERGYY
jgi:hypothetical protein